MIKVVLIGQGNVASHLATAFGAATKIEIENVNSRHLENIPNADVTIIAVSDDAIASVSNQLKNRVGLIVHTSGTVPMDAIHQQRKGVFYPLQSFTKGAIVDFSNIPFCLEATNKSDLELLEVIAKSIGEKSYHITTDQRKKLHLAAVFVNNFTNHMYQIGKDICDEHQVPFEILHPLIEETAKKIGNISPKEAQTGPAKRNDVQTILSHLENLNLQQQKIYKLITQSIQEN
ncbi:MAG: DUF2520 domain-containing protein [Flavobacteriaceae bacterium]|nr:DUF2520 domain-containing protein [Flavobacteriaceae bacterium]